MHLFFFFSLFFLQQHGGASRWRVGYQQGLTRLVLAVRALVNGEQCTLHIYRGDNLQRCRARSCPSALAPAMSLVQ